MKRLAGFGILVILCAGGVWSAVENYRIKHPVTGRDITVSTTSLIGMALFVVAK